MTQLKEESTNKMKELQLDKVTLNICVGNDKSGMVRAEKLLRKLTNKKPTKTIAKRRIAQWQIRPGLPIGYKVTLRGEDALKMLKWVLSSKGNKLPKKSLDEFGNFSVGFHEYLDLSGMKYDADIGILGFEMVVTFSRKGFRISKRRLYKSRVPRRHRVTKEEAIIFLEKLGVSVE